VAGLDDAARRLETLAARLREAGDTGLLRELDRAMRRATDPVPQEIRAGLKPKLPDRYAEVLDAELVISSSVRTTGRSPGVRLRGTTRGTAERRRIRRLDAGVLAHPLWRNRRHWYEQPVEPGWFTGPAKADAPKVRAELEQALHDVADKITKGP
jgi:hypothetical protein